MGEVRILEVIIGLVFLYLLLSLLATVINEMIANFFSLRGRNLRKAVAFMFYEKGSQFDIDKFYKDPFIKKLSHRPIIDKWRAKLGKSKLRGMFHAPADYLPKDRVSSIAVKAIFEDFATGKHKLSDLEPYIDKMFPGEEKNSEKPPNGEVNRILKRFLREADGNVDEFRKKLEEWFDQMMVQATEWYKARVRIILLFVGLVITVVFNADTLHISKTLWSDAQARAAVTAMAEQYVGEAAAARDTTSARDRARDLTGQIKQAQPFLGLGWTSGVSTTRGGWAMRALGWLLTTIAVSMGAPFWFDVLNRVTKLKPGGELKKEAK